jgi:hypothetical protein
VDLGGQRLGRRLDGAGRPGQVVRLLAGRASHHLAPELARPFHVDDDPARDVARQQPGTALQRDGLAERAVVQQQPGHRGDHVHPAGHSLDYPAICRLLLLRSGSLRASHGKHEQPRAVLLRDDVRRQRRGDRAGRAEQRAIDLPWRPRPQGGGELTLHGGARGEIDECRQVLAGRVAGRGPDQLAGLGVGPADRAVGLEHEQGNGGVLEHGPQQAPLGAERCGRRARLPGVGLGQLGHDLHRRVEFGERGVEQHARVGAGQRRGLA